MFTKISFLILILLITISCTKKNKLEKEIIPIDKNRIDLNKKVINKDDSKMKFKFQYNLSGAVYITYESQRLNDVKVELVNHKKEVVSRIITDYSGSFKFLGSGSLTEEEISKWYITLEKERYKTIKMVFDWSKEDNIYKFIKKIDIKMDCSGSACMDRCCREDEYCIHSRTKDGGFAKCIRKNK